MALDSNFKNPYERSKNWYLDGSDDLTNDRRIDQLAQAVNAGSGLPGRALGKLVGKTQRIGTPFQNRQFTSPAAGSYQCEPFAIASSIFKYFGVQNPEVLTGESAIDESAGVPNEKV
jgi:hypothetical protein